MSSENMHDHQIAQKLLKIFHMDLRLSKNHRCQFFFIKTSCDSHLFYPPYRALSIKVLNTGNSTVLISVDLQFNTKRL